jgi:hypothetical protein
LEKKVTPEASRTSIGDDIDKTIAAFLSKRLQADRGTFSGLTIPSGLAVPTHDLSLKRKRRQNKLKSGSGTDGADHATALVPPTRGEEFMEANNEAGNLASKINRSTSKLSRSVAVRNTVGLNAAIGVLEEATAATPEPAPDPRFASAQSPESESDSRPGSKQQVSRSASSAKLVRWPTGCPVIQGADSIVAGIARSSEGIATLRPFVAKSQSNAFRLE